MRFDDLLACVTQRMNHVYQPLLIRALEADQAASRGRLDDLFQSMLHRAFNGEL